MHHAPKILKRYRIWSISSQSCEKSTPNWFDHYDQHMSGKWEYFQSYYYLSGRKSQHRTCFYRHQQKIGSRVCQFYPCPQLNLVKFPKPRPTMPKVNFPILLFNLNNGDVSLGITQHYAVVKGHTILFGKTRWKPCLVLENQQIMSHLSALAVKIQFGIKKKNEQ